MIDGPAPPAITFGVATSDLASDQLTPEAAHDAIRQRMSDREFGKKLLARDPGATGEWNRLHEIAYPAPQAVSSISDVNDQIAARQAEIWNNYIGNLRQQFKLTPEQEQEIRGGEVNADVYAHAQEEVERLKKDSGFYRRLVHDRDREAMREWGLLTTILSLRPVPRNTHPGAK
jgi:hypothetical protein